MRQKLTIAFITSAYNEENNIYELYTRCKKAFNAAHREFHNNHDLEYQFIIADNNSADNSRLVLEQLSSQETAVHAILNHANYGPEASAVNALKEAGSCDFYVLLCSDLQDPPELVTAMIRTLLTNSKIDSVFGVKNRSTGNLLTRMARRSYYRALDYTSRLQVVPNGFHGFGCYRESVIQDTLEYWDNTDLNLRQCLANASQATVHIGYDQDKRKVGVSSYGTGAYWVEAIKSLLSGDAVSSRLALMISGLGFGLSVLIALLLLANYLSGQSGYTRGIPTIIGLTLLALSLESLMIAMRSRQLESLRVGGFRAKVRFKRLIKN